ncbi:MAG: hypothetical protein B5M53_04105 [Candidatus Cloacimonas sp. 4484_209]|nr:MAG: hypothetical protein B5M53_04105 [Candidatus Cloacimonas sp. 4484_209]
MAKTVKKKKITRHELKEDRFLETTKDFITFFRANSSRIILTVIILAVVAIGVRVYLSNKKSSEEKARIKMLYADNIYENGNFKDAVVAYQDIIKVYGGTKSAQRATLFLANSYFFSGDMDNALDYYNKAYKLLKKNPNLASAALMGVGSVYEQKGSFDEAIKYYDEVITDYKDTPARIDALFAKARCLEFSNRFADAIKVYEQIKMDYPDATFTNDATQRITFLRGAVESQRIEKGQ